MNRTLGNIYNYTRGEELANTISHGVMAILALLTIPFAVIYVSMNNMLIDAIGTSIYMLSLFSMFLVSTLYHMMPTHSNIKQTFHLFDHIFIYVTIAGCYTPPALSIIGGIKGYILVALQWLTVAFGVFYKTLLKKSHQWVSISIYLVMGWSALAFIPELIHNSTTEFLVWLTTGGVLYTIGAIIYATKGFRYHHLVWHLFINLAAVCQFLALVIYIK